jgi:hypothetical protein
MVEIPKITELHVAFDEITLEQNHLMGTIPCTGRLEPKGAGGMELVGQSQITYLRP